MKSNHGILPAILIVAAVVGVVASFVWRGPNWAVIGFTTACLGVLVLIVGKICQQRSPSDTQERE